MFEEKIDPEIISIKYKMQDLVHNYFKNNKKLDYLEFKIISDLDEIESLNFEVNTLKEILKQFQKFQKETCKRCQFKILQNIKILRNFTPNKPEHIRRKVDGRRNIKILLNNKRSLSPEIKELNTDENIGDISSISRDDDRISYISIGNNNIMTKKNEKLIKNNNEIKKNYNINNKARLYNINKNNNISKNKIKTIYENKKVLTPNKQLIKKRNFNKDKYRTIVKKENVSDNEVDKNKITKKSFNKKKLNNYSYKKNNNIKNNKIKNNKNEKIINKKNKSSDESSITENEKKKK